MRVDFYTQVHIKQREELFAFSVLVGKCEFVNLKEVSDIYNKLIILTNDLRAHAYHEETFIHPLLEKKIPEMAKNLQDEHQWLEKSLDDLEIQCHHLQMLDAKYAKRHQQGLEFYRLLNRFIARYLIHVDEEEIVMRNLWEVAANIELMAQMIAFQIYCGKENGKKWLNQHLPEINAAERVLMLKTAHQLTPKHLFETMCELTEEVLGADEWQLIANQLGY